MLFNSSIFAQFFAAFLLLYWLVRNHLQARNILVVAASYYFYGSWNVWFLLLLVLASVVDYWMGLLIGNARDPRRRKLFLTVSVAGNLTLLGFFKYSGFFVSSFVDLMSKLDVQVSIPVLNIVLPMGISFYTFQTMSYTIDVYRGEIKPTRNLINFLAFVSFFPQLVAGPIERAKHMLPQWEQTRVITFTLIQEGIWLSLWGMFKKVVVADNLAPLVEMIYGRHDGTAWGTVLGTVAFAVQIYCDFSGYSDIARGTAKILGFDIMRNFNIPYAATSIRDFWRRWHISLSTWLRDYLYVSLGGNRKGPGRTYVNLMLTMLLGGLWHGAAWNYLWWGLWHGAALAVHRFFTAQRKSDAAGSRSRPAILCGWVATMVFVLYSWLLFRARSAEEIYILTLSLGNFATPPWLGSFLLNLLVFIAPVVVMEYWQVKRGSETPGLSSPWWVRTLIQGTILLAILMFWEKRHVPFIYFQF